MDERERRLKVLEDDLRSGKITRDILTESSVGFDGEFRAMYYSNACRNMSTVVAHEVMESNQQLDDIQILRKIKNLKEAQND